MADVTLNPVVKSLRGKVSDLVFKKINGKVFLTRKPDMSRRVLTKAQRAMHEQFRQAAAYGRMALANPSLRAYYAAAALEKKKPIFSLMFGDYFHPPEVHEIDVSEYIGQAGNTIGVRVDDDFKVIRVDVAIKSVSGYLIEHGEAMKSAADQTLWLYAATTSVPAGTQLRVEVNVIDRLEHMTTKIVDV